MSEYANNVDNDGTIMQPTNSSWHSKNALPINHHMNEWEPNASNWTPLIVSSINSAQSTSIPWRSMEISLCETWRKLARHGSAAGAANISPLSVRLVCRTRQNSFPILWGGPTWFPLAKTRRCAGYCPRLSCFVWYTSVIYTIRSCLGLLVAGETSPLRCWYLKQVDGRDIVMLEATSLLL